jgi:Holliday junction resolvase RusA-like endonuclease
VVITIKGQVRGGKNHIIITKTGHRFPNKKFAEWAVGTIWQIRSQRGGYPMISSPEYDWKFDYTPENNQRRDITAVLDAVFHCLEKAGVVSDDRWIQNITFRQNPANKENAGIVITANPAEKAIPSPWVMRGQSATGHYGG